VILPAGTPAVVPWPASGRTSDHAKGTGSVISEPHEKPELRALPAYLSGQPKIPQTGNVNAFKTLAAYPRDDQAPSMLGRRLAEISEENPTISTVIDGRRFSHDRPGNAAGYD
jgi:hypothetical protein